MTQREAESSEIQKRAPMDFGELRNDTDFITKSTNLEKVSIYSAVLFVFSSN